MVQIYEVRKSVGSDNNLLLHIKQFFGFMDIYMHFLLYLLIPHKLSNFIKHTKDVLNAALNILSVDFTVKEKNSLKEH